MARDYIRTVTDMERYFYGAGNAMGYSYSGSELLKADSPMLSTTTGIYQAIYGRKVWSQLNQEFNAFSILPKRPWERSGWRVITSRPCWWRCCRECNPTRHNQAYLPAHRRKAQDDCSHIRHERNCYVLGRQG